MKCRFCNASLHHVFIDLVNSPASNSFLSEDELNEPEVYFPLKVYTCHECFLVQVDEYKKSDAIFNKEYVYFSSYSKTWLAHAKKYVDEMMERFSFINNEALAVELASNDGYLLQYFNERGVKVLGVEPTANTAEVAIGKGIETEVDFFGVKLAKKLASEGKMADILLGNNVLAHVPDILDFVGGMKILLNPGGVITMEFPHLLQLIENSQFDTIYHEHFSYLSFTSVHSIFASCGIELFDVEELSTHGGSLRIFGKHLENSILQVSDRVGSMLKKELDLGITSMNYYNGFQQKAMAIKLDLTEFLINQKRLGKKVAAYGAAAKGNTLLNYCGIKNDLIDFVVDANPHKRGKYLPGSHIPVKDEIYLKNEKPDFVIILPWNLKEEISQQLEYIKTWGGKFVIPIPTLQILGK